MKRALDEREDHPRMTARRWKILLALGSIAVLGLPFLMLLGAIGWQAIQDRSHRRPFQADSWRRQGLTEPDGPWPPRLCMVDDLLDRGLLTGKTQADVIERLGSPTGRMGQPGATTVQLGYLLGPERGLFRIDSESLLIEIGPAGKVTRQWLHRD